MALSEHEQQVLSEIEALLMQDDPRFRRTVAHPERSGGLTLQGIALLALGLCLLLGGAMLAAQSLWFIALSVVGFLLMFTAGVWMIRGTRSRRTTSASTTIRSSHSASSSSEGGIAHRLEDNFRRRFSE